jgi:SAM-dependent methyltransferase
MPHLHPDIYASAPMRALLASESALLGPELARSTGDHALHLGPVADITPPPLPLLGHWARLHARGNCWRGDVLARVVEPLPFLDDSFGVVVLRHALEVAVHADALFEEAVRVLAPGGVLAVTGVHPLGAWSPWFQWRSRGMRATLQQPVILRARCARADLDVYVARRVGRFFPSGSPHGEALWGGAYVLLARKRRVAATPLRVAPSVAPANVTGTLVSGARRSAR